MRKALAFDVGGTKIYSSIVNEKGQIIGEINKYKTPTTFDGFIELYTQIISKYEPEVDAIAFATAGAVNNKNTRVISSTANLIENYRDIDFTSLSKKRVLVENDANAAAWAEHKIGASKGYPISIMLTLGTGVGGGIILNNKLYKGKSGAAGEMHFKMYPDKRRKCTCGAYDCFEAYASGTGLRTTAQLMLEDTSITTYDVIEGLKSGDEQMIKIFNTWQNDLLAGIIGLSNIFDPHCIVLSGSMAEFVDVKYLEEETNKEILCMPIKVLRATMGNYSGMIGAALLALEA